MCVGPRRETEAGRQPGELAGRAEGGDAQRQRAEASVPQGSEGLAGKWPEVLQRRRWDQPKTSDFIQR